MSMDYKQECYYRFANGEFKKLTKKWLNKKTKWKKYKLCICILTVTAILLFGLCIYSIGKPTNYQEAAIIGIAAAVGAILAIFPILAAVTVYFQGIKKIGDPFANMSRMFLFTNYSGIQFGYHDKVKGKNPEAMNVWQIAYKNIQWVNIDTRQRLITVYGRTEMVEFADMSTGRVARKFTSGQFGEFGSFSFFDCFDKREQFLQALRENGVKIQESCETAENREQFLNMLQKHGVQVQNR